MTAPTYAQQQTPQHLFGQTPGYDPFSPFGTSIHGFGGPQTGLQTGGLQGGGFGQPWTQQPWTQQQYGQQFGQQGNDLYTLAWQLLGYAQQSIQLAQQIVAHSFQQQQQQQQVPYQMMGQLRGFQRQPMAW